MCFTRAFHIGTDTIAVVQPLLRPVPCRVTHQAGQEWLWRAGEATCCSGSQSGKTTEDKGTEVLSCLLYSVIWITTDYAHSTVQRTFDPVTRCVWKPHILVLVFQERELVLKRIAEDRKSQQEKMQAGASSEKSPPSGQEQKLGGKVQTNVDNNCLLMVKLQTIKTHTADSSNLTCIFVCRFGCRRASPCASASLLTLLYAASWST